MFVCAFLLIITFYVPMEIALSLGKYVADQSLVFWALAFFFGTVASSCAVNFAQAYKNYYAIVPQRRQTIMRRHVSAAGDLIHAYFLFATAAGFFVGWLLIAIVPFVDWLLTTVAPEIGSIYTPF